MTIPMGVAPSDPLDVQVEVPPGCPTKSLAGGYLLTARLFRVTYGDKGQTLRDHELALARGPVMIGTPAKPNDPKVGRVLGGGRVKKEYPYTLVIKENRESYYTAKMLESVVNAAVPPDRGRAPEGGGDRQDRQLPGAAASPSCTTRTSPATSGSSSPCP